MLNNHSILFNSTLRVLRLLTVVQLAWIAGFMDGDGHIGCRIKTRHDYKYGFQLVPMVSFVQKDKRGVHLFPYLHSLLNCIGIVRDRKDGMFALEIECRDEACALLVVLMPYLILKKKQAKYCLDIMSQYDLALKDPKLFIALCLKSDRMSQLNDSKRRTITSANVISHFKKKKFV